MNDLEIKYGKNKGAILTLMKKKCDFNAEHNGFEWTGELKTKQISETTGINEEDVKSTIQELIGLGFITQYKTFEVYQIEIKI
jgi:hypothetical protein